MIQMLDSELSLGAKNALVHWFKYLVYYKSGLEFKIETQSPNSVVPPRYIAELDKDLYSKAVALPECGSVSLSYTDNASKFKYGKFSGGVVYSTFDGDIDEKNKDVQAQEGWLITDRSSDEYALFRSANGSYIIAINTFTPEAIVKDFTPLYDKLNEQIKHYNSAVEDSVKYDTKHVGALAASKKNAFSDFVTGFTKQEYDIIAGKTSSSTSDTISESMNKARVLLSEVDSFGKTELYLAWLLYMHTTLLWEGAVLRAEDIKARIEALLNENAGLFNVYPKQIGAKNADVIRNNALQEVQAILYAIPDGDVSEGRLNQHASGGLINHGIDLLVSYQTPETINYNAQGNYESVVTRGSQQPIQYYNNAGQIELSFTLKWHIDEVRTFGFRGGFDFETYKTLQDIAESAENLTRPWTTDAGSNKRKLCCVILPSISRIGYIVGANISYSGDMTGSRVGILNTSATEFRQDTATTAGPVSEYGYTQLEVSFSMIVVQDVTLKPADNHQYEEFYLESTTYDRDNLNEPSNVVSRELNDINNNSQLFRGIRAAELAADLVGATTDVATASVNLADAAAKMFV